MISVSAHHRNVKGLGCIITKRRSPTIHHIHGGSVMAELGYDWHPGVAQRQNHYLVIPLWGELHVGRFGIDGSMGVLTWEATFGAQMDWLRQVSGLLGYDVMELARAADGNF